MLEVRNGKNNLKYYAMNSSYTIHMLNNTDDNYFFAVYQTFPSSPGLKSLAWQIRRLPKRGSQPTCSDVTWFMNYGIAITNWDANLNGYTGEQYQDADLGQKYQVVSNGSFPTIDPTPIGTTGNSGEIAFTNNTQSPNATDLSMGFTINSNLVCSQEGVHANESVLFDVHPTYYVACYRSIQLGQLVDSDVVLGPVEVKFRDGNTVMNVEAFIDGGEYKMRAF